MCDLKENYVKNFAKEEQEKKSVKKPSHSIVVASDNEALVEEGNWDNLSNDEESYEPAGESEKEDLEVSLHSTFGFGTSTI